MDYKDYEKLIKKISWSWHKTTGIEFETLESEANVAFAECQNNYNPKRSKFSTLLWHAIESRFKNLLKRNHLNRYDGIEVELEEMALSTSSNQSNQERNCIFANLINNLSKEAKEITSIVLEAPADLIEMLPKPRLSKHQLTKYLRLKGWKIPAILKGYAEIKQNLNF